LRCTAERHGIARPLRHKPTSTWIGQPIKRIVILMSKALKRLKIFDARRSHLDLRTLQDGNHAQLTVAKLISNSISRTTTHLGHALIR
jgi:hypothetical protein